VQAMKHAIIEDMQKKHRLLSKSHVVWCLSNEFESTVEHDDAFCDQLNQVILAEATPIIATLNLVHAVTKRLDFKNWKTFVDVHQKTSLLIPKDRNDFINENALQLLPYNNQKSARKYVPEIGSIKRTLQAFLDASNPSTQWAVILVGHGSNPYSREKTKPIETWEQCGTTIKNLRATFEMLCKYKTLFALYKGCYGGSPDMLNYLAEKEYSYPLISGAFCDAVTRFSPNNINPKTIKAFCSNIEKLPTKLTLNEQQSLYDTIDSLLNSEYYPEHTPLVLWPQKKQFQLLQPCKQSPSASDSLHQISPKKIFLVKAATEKLFLQEIGQRALLHLGNPHTSEYTIEHLTVPNINKPEKLVKNIYFPPGFRKQRRILIKTMHYKMSNRRVQNLVINIYPEKKDLSYEHKNLKISQKINW
jgi:hypothetical protein